MFFTRKKSHIYFGGKNKVFYICHENEDKLHRGIKLLHDYVGRSSTLYPTH